MRSSRRTIFAVANAGECYAVVIALAVGLACLALAPALAQQQLSPKPPMPMPGGDGPFIDLCFDESAHRILAARKNNGSLTIFDITSKFAQSMPSARYGEIAIDGASHQIYIAAIDGILLCLSYDIFKVQKEIKLPGPAKAITIDTKRHLIYVGSNDSSFLWVVDPKTAKVAKTIALDSVPEATIYDSETDKIYLIVQEQNANAVYVIDPVSAKVISTWSTGRARRLSSLALDLKGHLLFVAGRKGKLSVIDLMNGQLVRTVKIADDAEQIVYDQESERVYCACASGAISVFDNKSLDDVAERIEAPPNTGAIALEQQTHDVWIGFVAGGRGYLQRYVQSSH